MLILKQAKNVNPFYRMQQSLFEQQRVLIQLRPQPLPEAVHLPLERQLPPQRLLGARLRSNFQHCNDAILPTFSNFGKFYNNVP